MKKEKSELGEGLRGLSRALTGVAAQLLGPKVIGEDSLPDTPAISPEADAAIRRAGERIGGFLHAAGEGLKAHPLHPEEALKEARAHREDHPTPPEGWSPLAGGFVTLGEGLLKVTEGVLDVVAPRKAKASAEEGEQELGESEREEEGGGGAAEELEDGATGGAPEDEAEGEPWWARQGPRAEAGGKGEEREGVEGSGGSFGDKSGEGRSAGRGSKPAEAGGRGGAGDGNGDVDGAGDGNGDGARRKDRRDAPR